MSAEWKCGAIRMLWRDGRVGLELTEPGTAVFESPEQLVEFIKILVDVGQVAFGVVPMSDQLIQQLDQPLRPNIQ